jgi:LSD1 subclass zinc finger protein
MDGRLVVATECPTCGAPLDFTEGSNAVRCGHCGANLLVTGRKQVLSYYLAPKIEPRDATLRVAAACREQGRAYRVVGAERYFLPYYRLTGQDLRWEAGTPAHEASGAALALAEDGTGARLGRIRDADTPPSELRDRYVDKSFPACSVGWGLYSLGVRASVLRLRLYSAEVLATLGHVVAADVGPDEARARGIMTVGVKARILYRHVLGEQLSLVYFPFCVVELAGAGATRLAIVDGVSGSIVSLDADARVADVLRRAPGDEQATVGFRPLVCPNCGWDLPVRPDDAVFYCGSCTSAFQIVGHELQRVRFAVASPAGTAGRDAVRYLPLWVLRHGADARPPGRFLVPAFRFRRLKILVDLTRDLSRREWSYDATDAGECELHGCYYDQDDAARLAEIAYPGLALDVDRAIEELAASPLAFAEHSLTWFPFRREAGALRDPFTGRAVDERLLL